MRHILCAAVVIVFGCSSSLQGDLINFKVTGNGGDGLLGTNITPPPANFGSGGLGPDGIVLDTDTNFLTIDIEWGEANGFEDLTGPVEMLHLHGPTPSNAPNSFDERGPLLINLGNAIGFDPNPSSGGLFDEFFLSNMEVDWLLNGRTYINVHTEQNLEFGEIRGYLVIIPEPSSMYLLLLICLALPLVIRRRLPVACPVPGRR